jgi:hypothetical protein
MQTLFSTNFQENGVMGEFEECVNISLIKYMLLKLGYLCAARL